MRQPETIRIFESHGQARRARDDVPPPCDADDFRAAMGHFATGVTVVTTAEGDRWYGMTASAVASVSLEPPMLLVCINRDVATHAAVRDARRFAVNVLAADQAHVAEHFAQHHEDKFTTVAVRLGAAGVPLLADALAHLECTIVDEAEGGTHSVFVAEVHAVDARPGEPLVHFRGDYHELAGELARAGGR